MRKIMKFAVVAFMLPLITNAGVTLSRIDFNGVATTTNAMCINDLPVGRNDLSIEARFTLTGLSPMPNGYLAVITSTGPHPNLTNTVNITVLTGPTEPILLATAERNTTVSILQPDYISGDYVITVQTLAGTYTFFETIQIGDGLRNTGQVVVNNATNSCNGSVMMTVTSAYPLIWGTNWMNNGISVGTGPTCTSALGITHCILTDMGGCVETVPVNAPATAPSPIILNYVGTVPMPRGGLPLQVVNNCPGLTYFLRVKILGYMFGVGPVPSKICFPGTYDIVGINSMSQIATSQRVTITKQHGTFRAAGSSVEEEITFKTDDVSIWDLSGRQIGDPEHISQGSYIKKDVTLEGGKERTRIVVKYNK